MSLSETWNSLLYSLGFRGDEEEAMDEWLNDESQSELIDDDEYYQFYGFDNPNNESGEPPSIGDLLDEAATSFSDYDGDDAYFDSVEDRFGGLD